MTALADTLRNDGRLLAMMATGELPLRRADVAKIAEEVLAAAKAIDTAAAHATETAWQRRGKGPA